MKQLLVLFFAIVSFTFSFAQNPIVTENALTGNPKTEWDITGAGDLNIQGFATDISVNKGQTIHFKIETSPAAAYTIKIYRIGYYQGNGARLIANLGSFSGIVQPDGIENTSTGLIDCSNWSESASWAVPATAVSGLYIARLTKTSTSTASHIAFIVRDDASTAEMLLKTSDATWQAYNVYGGNSLYVGTTSFPNGHAAKVSYNRPYITRNGGGGGGVAQDWFMNAEFPMIRFLERNGYNITYTTDVDMDRDPTPITPSLHKMIISSGHDEYWSLNERNKFEAARAAGVHLAFFSGNEVYWKTRWEDNNRTLVCYKEGVLGENVCGNKCDPTSAWTGLWRDGAAYDAGKPENGLTGQISWNDVSAAMTVTGAYKNLRFWRNTSVASLAANGSVTFTAGTIGYEWDYQQYPETYPHGQIALSSQTISGKEYRLSLYRHSSGALVFGTGTVQWAWGLDNIHDNGSAAASVPMQQATVNLFADMGVQPATIMSGLTLATASTDFTAPVVTITSPVNGATLTNNTAVTINGTASDVGGTLVGVEISVDGGTTWQAVTGSTNWTFSWTPTLSGPATIKVRGFDDSGNMGVPGASGSSSNINVTISGSNPTCPCNIFPASVSPQLPLDQDGQPIELGVKFRSSQAGYITGVRFWKGGAANSGTHVGHLWSSTGTKLAEANFTGETSSGWQTVTFTSPVAIAANTTYVASYFSPTGYYASTNPYFNTAVVNGFLTALANGTDGPNGTYIYTATGAFPNNSFQSSNNWVDVVYNPTVAPDLTPPTVSMTGPAAGNVSAIVNVTANASDNVGVAGVQFLLNGANLGAEVLIAPYSYSWNTTTVANGTYTLTARARDGAGNTTTSTGVVVTVSNVPDTQAPTVNITAPAAGNVTNTVTVTANAADNIAVAGVQFLLNGVNLGAEDVASPYSISWNTFTSVNGTYTLTARARDAAGNITTSPGVVVTVSNSSNLVVALPLNEGTGTAAADISGNSHPGTLTNTPTWTTGKYGQGVSLNGTNNYINIADHADFTLDPAQSYTWSAWVKNNNFTEWSTVWSQTLDASNFFYFYAHTTTDPDGGPVTNGLSVYWWANGGTNKLGTHSTNNVLTAGQWSYVAITYDASQPQNNRFTIYVNGVDVTDRTDVSSTGTLPTINPTNIRIGSDQPFGEYLNGSVDEVRYYKRLLSSAEVVTDMNSPLAPDVTAPTVNITAPAAGNVSGTINVNANAADNVGVAGVQFLLNGVTLGAEDTASPYSVSWNTTTVANGNYTLTAKARDAAGNSTTSTGVIVTVNNVADTQAPTVNITAPAAGNVSGTINVDANAADNIGVVGVQFLLNGVNLGSEDLVSPYSVSWNTIPVANGTYTLTARARDAAGNSTTSAGVIVTVNNVPDTQAPTVNITAPAAGNVSGTINVNANAADNIGVVGVQFLLNGVNLGAEDVASPYSISWNTFTSVNGTYTLTARARDAAGNSTTSAGVVVTVNNSANLIVALPLNEGTGTAAADISGNNHPGTLTNTPTWTTGKYGQGVSLNGTSSYINIADHTDFSLDPAQSYTWEGWIKNNDFHEWATVWSQTLNSSNFFYFYAHTSTDVDGGPVTNGISVYWWNGAGANKIGAHSSNNVLTAGVWSHVAVTYDASQPQNNRFTIYVNGVDVTVRTDVSSTGTIVAIDPANIRIGSNQPFGEYLNGSVDEFRYYKRLLSSAEVISDMNSPLAPDLTAPTVNITAPAAGNVSGTINVTANSADNVGVAGVQFLLNGVNLGAEDIASPYSVSWNTTTVANGTYTLTAKARDAAGNSTTSLGVIVTVNNVVDTQAPTVNITAPAAGNVSATINVDANAADNIGVVGVQFLLNGVNLGAEDVASPYSISWNTTTVANGTYTLTAKARDAAGNSTTSAGVIVTVNNVPDTQAPTVNITAPAAGNVSGTINVNANAADNVGVVGVQFLLNGVNLGSEDLASPYTVSWNTLTSVNGTYTLTARARDAAGNSTTSAGVVVNINNSSNLIVALNLNEGAGTTAADISGNSHNGVLTNGPTWGAGKYGQATNFDGTNDYINIADHADFTLDPAQSYTWSSWVKNNNFNEWSPVWSQTVDINNFFYFYAHTTPDVDGGPVTNGISVYWWSNGGTNMLGAHSSNNVLTAGQWSHVAVTYDASQPQNNRFTIYVNGVDVTVRTDVASVGTLQIIDPTSIRVGSDQPFNEYLNGSFDEVRYYRRLLQAAEVQADMNSPIANGIVPTVTPVNGAANVSTAAVVSSVFNVVMDATTINGTNIELRNASNTIVPSVINYNAASRTATLTPSSALANSAVYTAKIKGGASGVKDAVGNTMPSDLTWTFTTVDPPLLAPTEGPGGPILVISATANPFSRFAVEILRAEGLNQFAAADISTITATVLNNYDVVVLGEMTVTAAQVTLLTNWVNAGGTLIAFRPSALLNPLLGISNASGTLVDKYLLVNTASGAGVGIVNQTIQFHGTADLHTLSGATSLATLYSAASTATSNPAVTTINVGASGGRAIAFTYDLSKSIIYTRQGNPAWAGQKRDGQIDPIRSDDMFFPDWIDFNKVAIPQADEQQRLLANIILQGNLHRKPLPRFWYLPRDLKAAIVMTGDDHGVNGTTGRFNQYLTLGPNTAQDVADWKAVRGTSYVYPNTPMTDGQAASFQAQGFEIALHPNTNCLNYTLASLQTTFTTQLTQFAASFPSLSSPATNRTHCLAWSDWASQPKTELLKNMRLDATYYYWPAAWVQDRPGMFTGSGMPMRFADTDGSLIDVYQATTQMTDESGIGVKAFCDAVLDKAIGSQGYYGVFTCNMHTDTAIHIGSNAIIASAQARQIPIISAKQMLTWLDGRNNSYFGNITWSGNLLSFIILARSDAKNLKAMLPLYSETGQLISITMNGNAVAFTTQTIKGIQYAFFPAASGNNAYVANYNGALPRMMDPTQGTTPAVTLKQPDEPSLAEKMEVSIMPNPSNDYFNLVINSKDASPVSVRVLDVFGQAVEKHENVSSGSLRIGQALMGGTYFAEVIQGGQRKVVKIIKIN